MRTIKDLPPELWEPIIALCSISDLSRLSRACTQLHGLLTPLVYHSIDWLWEDGGRAPPLDLLLRSLLLHPKLGRYVKSFRLRGEGIVARSEWTEYWLYERRGWRPTQSTRSIWTSKSDTSIGFSQLQRVDNLVTAAGLPYASLWIQELERGNIDTIVALILYHLQGLERLDLGFFYLHRSQFLPAILRHRQSHQIPICTFPDLVYVEFASDVPSFAEGFWADDDLFRPLLCLDKLSHLSIALREPVIFAWPGRPPLSTSLIHLALISSSISEDSLDRILQCTPNLKHLAFDHRRMIECSSLDYIYSTIIKSRRLVNAFKNIEKTLESLDLRVEYETDEPIRSDEEWSRDYNCSVVGSVNSLTCMTKLVHLDISWVLLFGWEVETARRWEEVLPPRIESLCIRDDLRDFTEYQWYGYVTSARIQELLAVCHKSFPRLRQLSFSFNHLDDYNRWLLHMADAMRETCKNAGIAFEIRRGRAQRYPWEK